MPHALAATHRARSGVRGPSDAGVTPGDVRPTMGMAPKSIRRNQLPTQVRWGRKRYKG